MKKILVIDDDADLAETTKSVLEYAGFQAVTSESAEAGIKAIQEDKPDLILMDIKLPGMLGSEALKILKENEEFKHIPVIFLTGLLSYKKEELEEEGLKVSGVAYQFMSKPYDNAKLLELISTTLNADDQKDN